MVPRGYPNQIHSLDPFLDDATGLHPHNVESKDVPDAPVDLLARIVELEELLAADKARKPKFRKPERQAAWQSELARLNRLL